MSKPSYTYRVVSTTTVDHPEKRNDSYRPVPAGTKVQDTHTFTKMGAAMRWYRELLAGESDFGSEYISSCSCLRVRADGITVATVGDLTYRHRLADGKVAAYERWTRGERVDLCA